MEIDQGEVVVKESGMFPWKLMVLIVLAAVLVTVIVVSVGVYMWREVAYQQVVKGLERKLELALVVQQQQDIEFVEEKDVAPSVSSLPVKEGWQTYTHARYNYQIDYPKGAVVTESGPGIHIASKMTGLEGKTVVEENVPYLDGLCVVIANDFGSVSISAPGNRYVTCGPTGVGSDAEQQSKNVTIDGSLLKASGYRGLSQEGQASEYGWFEFATDSGFSVVYEVSPKLRQDFDRYEEVKSVIEEMVATFRSID